MIVGVAGHVDHGKSALVRALTGVDTDRLKEEKARGISIDLGFAYMPGDNGDIIGFVDAPGHHRFIRNMIAGAAGIGNGLVALNAQGKIGFNKLVRHIGKARPQGVTVGTVANRPPRNAAKSNLEQLEPLPFPAFPVVPAGIEQVRGGAETRGIEELGGLLPQ